MGSSGTWIISSRGDALLNILAALLILEAFGTVRSLTQWLPAFAGYAGLTVVLIGLRAVVAAVQLVSGVLLWSRQDSAFVLARTALIASAALITCEVGWRMTPTNADPTFRWWIVGVYWVYAALASWRLTREKRSGRLSR